MGLTNQKAFTLIELLIVTTLLSLLMFTGSYAYSLFTNKWQSELGQFSKINKQMMAFHRIETLLTNLTPYPIRQDNSQPAFLFIGNKDSILAVTHDGLFSQNSAEAFRLSSVKTSDGTYQLLYQAKSLEHTAILTESQEIIFTNEIILLDNLNKIEFYYYGWSSYQEKKSRTADNQAGSKKWYEVYSGIDKQLTPEKIEIKLTQGKKQITINLNLDTQTDRWLASYFDGNNND